MSINFSLGSLDIFIRSPIFINGRWNNEIFFYLKKPKLIKNLNLNNDYKIVNYKDNLDKKILKLLKSAGFHFNLRDYKNVLDTCIPDGIHLIEHTKTGNLASIMFSQHFPTRKFPFGGRIGWLATCPNHRNRGLGQISASLAVNNLIKKKYKNIYVSTHEKRIYAKKIFESLGFQRIK